MTNFIKLVFTPAGCVDAALAIAASRAGGIGILNAELSTDPDNFLIQLHRLSRKTCGEYGIKLDAVEKKILIGAAEYAEDRLRWLILDCEMLPGCMEWTAGLRQKGVRVLAEVKSADWPVSRFKGAVDGLVLKGHESGGFVGENGAFILLQKWLKNTDLPLFVRGGISKHSAAACSAVGAAGGVLDSQVLLLDESPLARDLYPALENLSGSETIAVGDPEEGGFFRLLVRPGCRAACQFCADGEGKKTPFLKRLVEGKIDWKKPENGLLPIGQDACFAGVWGKKYGRMASLFRAIDSAVESSIRKAVEYRSLSENAPLARSLGVPFPIVQGPMARVSDNVGFACAVSKGGALPTMALSLLKGDPLNRLLDETSASLNPSPWGIGLLGFAPQALLDEQMSAAIRRKPAYAVIAGGRPDQADKLEAAGIPAFLHVPTPSLMSIFLREGARRFIFEGRECGGHIAPIGSFVLWSAMVDRLLAELSETKIGGEDIYVLFAGGIHDAVSSAMVQVLAAPLADRGVRIGILMGSGYIFTEEIVQSGALTRTFQEKALECERTVCLQSGPGHASRCAYTPFAKTFFRKCGELREANVPVGECREILETMIMGRLQLAARGCARMEDGCELKAYDESYQQSEGMYMLGQLSILRETPTDIASLHREVTEGSNRLLAERLGGAARPEHRKDAVPADIAIVGISAVFPKAGTLSDYWENILGKVDAITEVPSHRWDWRLYFDENRYAKDKVYSRWGGFIEDITFDPTRYGIPPRSIPSVDPMQLMALELAWRTLVDAGCEHREFDRERTAVIIGASGGIGDVGMQYGVRAELPRFQGSLPDPVAECLPDWTEDTFAGILPNVIAGRISNRLNLGGVNFTTDAACASSLAAIYQGVTELTSGKANLVIAGGVDASQSPFGFMCFSKTQALSPNGRCRSLDSSADGIVISEGIAMIAMKRLEDAEREGDRIYAVIKGIGGSSDGRVKGLSAPEPAGQLLAMRRAYDQAGFSPETVGLLEAHGTGTVVGDTAELESTTRLLKEAGCKSRRVAVGSVKTLIGHTKATAGVAGLIKAALALHHRVLPPHFPVEQPNRVLQQESCPLYLPDEAFPWLSEKGRPRRAACSAFGFGGTNFHVVMEEYAGEYRPWMRSAATRRWPAELLVWTGAGREDLIRQLARTDRELGAVSGIELRDLAFSLARHRQSGGETVAIVAADAMDIRKKISGALSFLKGESAVMPPGVYHRAGAAPAGKTAVLFSGQGSQRIDMFRELALHFPVFSESLSEADDLLSERFEARFGEGVRLSHFIFPRGAYGEKAKADASRALTGTDVAQPALGSVGAGLWGLMRSFGLEADMLGGHSYGEFVALFASGLIDFRSMIAISEARGRFIVDAAKNSGFDSGSMAAVQAARADVEKAIAGMEDLILANHNAPQQSVISGGTSAVRKAVEKMAKDGIAARELPVAAAFHSRFVAPAQAELAEIIRKTAWREDGGAVPVYSNTTGEPHAKEIGEIKRVMTDHLVKPVEFVHEIEAMYRDGARVFLELGPKTVLTDLVGRILEGRPHTAAAVDGNGGGITGMLHACAQLLCAGVKLDITGLFDGRSCIDGDPADLSRIQRGVSPAEHAWMLNGSGARPRAEPIRQIGVRMDVSGARSAGAPRHKERQPVPSHPHSMVTGRLMPTQLRKEEPQMRGRGQIPHDKGPSVMADYFETMRFFLETQERVMSSYMGGVAPRWRSGAWQHRSALVDRLEYPAPEAFAEAPERLEERPEVVEREKAVPECAPPEAPVAKQNDKDAPVGRLDREKLTDMLLSIVEEKTGYPKSMVGLSQNMEADLGIDSIKRVEIVGALLKALPQRYLQSLDGDRAKLNTQPTLEGIVNSLIDLKMEGAVSSPFEQAGVGSKTDAPRLSLRHVIEPAEESIGESAGRRLEEGRFLLTPDALGIADELFRSLRARNRTVDIVPREALSDEASLREWCHRLKSCLDEEAVSGIVHLAQIGSERLPINAPLESWRLQLQRNEKSLFILLHALNDRLKEGAHILSASSLGGFFNRKGGDGSGLSLQGGAVGLLKSFHQERTGMRVKVVDVDPARNAGAIAADLLDELELVGGRHEVGYPGGKRTLFRTVPATITRKEERPDELRNLVVLASGGSRGVTAEVLRELALPGNTLLLTGRSRLPEDEPEELRRLKTFSELREHFVSQVRSGRRRLTPGEIRREIQAVLSAREIRLNIADFRERGAAVDYFQVDATDEAAMQNLLSHLYERYGKIDGVVHGAGVIEDKLLADKSSDSWSRVVETKVIGLVLLQKYLRPERLKFFTVFSSVAGRYGNSGQSDYATANELMNRLCCQLSRRWGDKVNVKALCWGPWGQTRFGAGMVTEYTEAKFAERGVKLVGAEAGRTLFRDELIHGSGGHVEVICGEGPWERQEAAVGRIETRPPAVHADPSAGGPLLQGARAVTLPHGETSTPLRLDETHAYLEEHRIDGVPVLPAAAALEIMAEAAGNLWPGWVIAEARECRLLKGIILKEPREPLSVSIRPSPYGSSDGFEVNASIQADGSGGRHRIHYRSVLRLAQRLPDRSIHIPESFDERELSAEEAYGSLLFHGPRFQVIEKIEGLSDRGASARVCATIPARWLAGSGNIHGGWMFDPAVVDAAAQMAIVWSRAYRNETALPVSFGRVVRYAGTPPEKLRMNFVRIPSEASHSVRANIYFTDADHRVVLEIEDLECVSSAELNRVGGTGKGLFRSTGSDVTAKEK